LKLITLLAIVHIITDRFYMMQMKFYLINLIAVVSGVTVGWISIAGEFRSDLPDGFPGRSAAGIVWTPRTAPSYEIADVKTGPLSAEGALDHLRMYYPALEKEDIYEVVGEETFGDGWDSTKFRARIAPSKVPKLVEGYIQVRGSTLAHWRSERYFDQIEPDVAFSKVYFSDRYYFDKYEIQFTADRSDGWIHASEDYES